MWRVQSQWSNDGWSLPPCPGVSTDPIYGMLGLGRTGLNYILSIMFILAASAVCKTVQITKSDHSSAHWKQQQGNKYTFGVWPNNKPWDTNLASLLSLPLNDAAWELFRPIPIALSLVCFFNKTLSWFSGFLSVCLSYHFLWAERILHAPMVLFCSEDISLLSETELFTF